METLGYKGKGFPLCHYNTCWLMKGSRYIGAQERMMCSSCEEKQAADYRATHPVSQAVKEMHKCYICGDTDTKYVHYTHLCNRHHDYYLSWYGECHNNITKTLERLQKIHAEESKGCIS